MEIFWRLILAHLLTDFTLQTDYIAGWKRKNVWGGIIHSFIFLICSAALCFRNLTDAWITIGKDVYLQGWLTLVILSAFHFLEDEWRVWNIQKLRLEDSFPFFIWDQFIHCILIFVFSPDNYGGVYPEKWVLLAILLILTTHFTTIFIFYLEKSFYKEARILVREKYYSMAERLALSSVLLLPGWWAAVFPAVWLGRVFINRFWRNNGFSYLNIIVGSLMAIAFGILARIIYYS